MVLWIYLFLLPTDILGEQIPEVMKWLLRFKNAESKTMSALTNNLE